MHKLIALIRSPADPDTFETRWAHEFVPLAERMPGLRRITHSRVHGAPTGPTEYYLMHEFYFDDREALLAAMTSPEGVAAGRTLMSIAQDVVTLLFAEHMEDIPRPQATAS